MRWGKTGVLHVFREGIMKPALMSKLRMYLLFAAAVLSISVGVMSCRTDEPPLPSLTGPSGHRLFLTMEANPDHLLILNCDQREQRDEISNISVQLKNQLGQGVGPGEHIRLRIVNQAGFEVLIGRLEDTELSTDSGGFARTRYVAPCKDDQLASTRIYIVAFLSNPNYVNEITGRHALELEIAGNPGPGAACGPAGLNPQFSFAPNNAPIGDQVCFDAQATTSAFAPIVSVKWSFGDGSTGSGLTVCHVYDEAGLYNARLTVRDGDKNECDTTQTVKITGGVKPTCSILVTPTPVAPDQKVLLIANVLDSDSGPARRFNWNFGDGSTTSTSVNSVTHSYKAEGVFAVVLTVTDDQGNLGVCTVSIPVVEVVGVAPTCDFTTSPSDPQPGDSIEFNSSTSTDEDGTISSFNWNFGDQSPSVTTSSTIISHSYSVAGTFTVTLIVTDNDGNSTVCTESVTVAPGAGLSPSCSFTGTPGSAGTFSASFDASASGDPDGSIVSYEWDFGDGSTSSTATPFTSHVYAAVAATYTVGLTVTDDSGNTTSCSITVTVS